MIDIIMKGVKEYGDELDVTLSLDGDRWVIKALNEAGFCCTEVDLMDVISWLRKNKPELLVSK